jgi:predicted MFS family arabinose efflux permease
VPERSAPPTVPEAALPLLAVAGFASMVAMRLCDAMLPALGQSFGLPAAQTSVAVSAFALAYGVMQLVAGPLGDRFGKPRVIAAAAFVCGLAAFGSALAPDLGALALGRVAMGGAAAGIIPLTLAWIGDQVPWERRQVVLARLLGYTVAGLMTGAWAGGVVADWLGWRWAFAGVGVLLVGAAVGIRRRRFGAPDTAAAAPLPYARRVAEILAGAWARRLYAVTLAEGALVFGVIAFVPSLLHERFAMPLSSAGAVLALFGLGGFVYSRSAAWLLRRWAPAALALGGGVLLCAAFGVVAWMPHWGWAPPAALVGGLGYYLLHGCLQTCATQVSSAARGTAVSLFACVLFLGQSAGVAAMAAAVSRGLAAPCIAAAGVALLALAWHVSRQPALSAPVAEAAR